MFIQQTDLFKGMSKSFMEELNKFIVTGNYKKGEFLFKAGEPAHHFYVLQQGRVRIIVGLAGHTITMASNPGESFGWSCLVGFDSYTATAECLVPCTLVKIEKEKLSALLEKDPASGLFFYKRLAFAIGQRLVNTYNMLLAGQSESNVPSYG